MYADFGFPNPEEAKVKADIAMLITKIIKEKDLTQQQATDLLNIDQPKVSKIIRGLLSEFSIERLLEFVLAFGFDIDIMPHSEPNAETQKAIRDVEENKKLTRYKDVDDFWADMGLDPNACNCTV